MRRLRLLLIVSVLWIRPVAAEVARTASAATPFPLGAYLYNPDIWEPEKHAMFLESFRSFTALMGTAPAFISSGVDFTLPIRDWPGSASAQAQSNRRTPEAKALTPVVAVPLMSTAPDAPPQPRQLAEFASGKHDEIIRGIVTGWTDQGFKTLYFRLGWEMNVAGTPYYVGDDKDAQATWVRAFQHMATVLRQTASAHGASAAVLWNPGIVNYGAAKTIEALYPGNRYVDAIAADVYADCSPFADSQEPRSIHDWNGREQVGNNADFLADPVNRVHCWDYPAANRWTDDASEGRSLSLGRLLDFAVVQHKPFAIPETGAGNSSSGGDISDDAAFPKWLAGKLHAAQGQGLRILFVNPWNANAGGNYGFSNPADGKPQEAAAWASYFGAQH